MGHLNGFFPVGLCSTPQRNAKVYRGLHRRDGVCATVLDIVYRYEIWYGIISKKLLINETLLPSCSDGKSRETKHPKYPNVTRLNLETSLCTQLFQTR